MNQKPRNQNYSNQRPKKKGGFLFKLLGLAAIVALICGPGTLYQFVAGGLSKTKDAVMSAIPFEWGEPSRPADRPAQKGEMISLAAQISKEMDLYSGLPEKSLLSKDKLSHKATIKELTQELAIQMQSSSLFKLLNQIQTTKKRESQQEAKFAKELSALSQELFNIRSGQALEKEAEAEARVQEILGEIDKVKAEAKVVRQFYKENIETQKFLLKQELASQGYQLKEEDLDALIQAQDVENILGVCQAFNTLKLLTQEIENQTRELPFQKDPSLSKHYYGAYTVLVITLNKIHKDYVKTLEEEHLPLIKTLQERTQSTLLQVTQGIDDPRGEENPIARKSLLNNAKQLGKTLSSLQKEEARLLHQKEKLLQAINRLDYSELAAQSTYQSISLQEELEATQFNADNEITAILKLSLPDMLIPGEIPSPNFKEDSNKL